MKLTKPTVSQIWNSLKGYRLAVNPSANRESSIASETVSLPDSQASSPPSSQEVGGSQSQNSVVSLGSSGSFNPQFEVCSLHVYYEVAIDT